MIERFVLRFRNHLSRWFPFTDNGVKHKPNRTMSKWADYCISAVRYNYAHTHIDMVKTHEDLGESIGPSFQETRPTVISKIKSNKSYVTIVSGTDGKWNKGQPVYKIVVNGTEYIKTVDNDMECDNLENLPEF